MSRGVASVALASVLTALLFSGCGLEGQPFSTSTDKTTGTSGSEAQGASADETEGASTDRIGADGLKPPIVTADAIGAYPEDSPEAAVLEWWRGVQTRDQEVVTESYSSAARDELPKKFPFALVTGIAPLASEASISVADIERDGNDESTVYVVIESTDPRMNGPLALPMKKGGGSWQITDSVFLGSIADTYISALRAFEKSAADGGQ